MLTTLQIAHNRLRTAEDIEELAHCPKLRLLSPPAHTLCFTVCQDRTGVFKGGKTALAKLRGPLMCKYNPTKLLISRGK